MTDHQTATYVFSKCEVEVALLKSPTIVSALPRVELKEVNS